VSGLFDVLTLRGLTIKNRIMMAPMCVYSAGPDGLANQWHITHYGSRAVGGTGLLMLEATAVESRGRLSGHDLGLWADEQVEPLTSLVSFCQEQGARVGVQLSHGGRKSWGGEPLVGPSPVPFDDGEEPPHQLEISELSDIVDSWAAAARRAVRAGFDCVEIHGAHGYLMNQFLSPLSNKRADRYGGPLRNRMRFPLEVTEAVRSAIGDLPLFYRVSAVDHAPGGVSMDEMVQFSKELRAVGVDLVDVSSGGIAPASPRTYPGYQVEYSRIIRNECGVATGAVGLITEPEFAEAIVQNGWADLMILGRELLRNPYWPLHAAAQLGAAIDWPEQYRRAKL